MSKDGMFSHPGVTICTESLSKQYQLGEERVTAVDGLSLEVNPQVPVALVGVSGCGKSTLLNLLGGANGEFGSQ